MHGEGFIAGVVMLIAAAAAQQEASPNLVVSDQAPQQSFTVDRDFTALPPLRFKIEDLTDVERRIFVKAGHDRRVERLVVFQFETAQKNSDFRFRYPSKPPRKFGKETYRFGMFGYDDEIAAQRDPEKEAGRTRAYLADAGFEAPRRYRVARLARVTDPEGRSEIIIFYMENADGQPAGAVDEDGDWELAPDDATALTSRMEAAIVPATE